MFPPVSQSPDPAASPDSTSTAVATVAEQNQAKPEKSKTDKATKKRNDEFRQRIATCKNYRRKVIANWTVSIDYRRGKPFTSQTDSDQVAVNLDWMLTKSKEAALFSQVPKIRLDHVPQTLPKSSPWLSAYEQKLNDIILTAGIEAAMAESMPDVINAAGFAAVLASFESLTEDREVPTQTPETNPAPEVSAPMDDQDMNATSEGMPEAPEGSLEEEAGESPEEEATEQATQMETVPFTLDKRYLIQRLSPSDFLWPTNFTGSDFEMAPWIGRTGRVTWTEAIQKFGLTEDDKTSVLGEDRPLMDKLTHDVERDRSSADDPVAFDEIFYKEYKYIEDTKSYSLIHHLVFVGGKEEPVIDEPWKGQKINEDGTILGATKYPIRVLTLTYLTDEAIPPSDSAIGRPQVDEINKARTQMIKQRERSLPVRWFDVNRIDPAIQQSLMRGSWQAMIPVQGEGSRTIGEVARAAMPPETFKFDEIAKADLREEFGALSQITADETAKGEDSQNKSSFNTRAGRERARVASFFVGIAEVLGGLMCLYEDPASFGEGFEPAVCQGLKYSILPDSTVLLDVAQKIERIDDFINKYAKSGWVNLEPVFQERATLTGLDPAMVIKAPQPRPPVEPNISLRLTGVEDLLNPLSLAFMIKSGQAPPAELIEKAKELIQQSVTPPFQPQNAPIGPGQQFFNPAGGGEGQPGAAPPTPPLPPQSPGPHPGQPLPAPPPHKLGEANPNMAAMPQVTKRSESGGKQ